MSIHKCWAENVDDPTIKLEFWDQFCPLFDWVAPEVVPDTTAWFDDANQGFGYLKVAWDRQSSIHSINFRKIYRNFLDPN